MPKVTITLPAYRAEHTLGRTIGEIPTGIADELILVDDASPDQTAAVARDLGIRVFVHQTNRGYGGNQKTCYQQAIRGGADIIVMLHPDYQYDPKAVPLLIAPILAGDADMTFGSRFAGLGDPRAGGMPWYRFIGNRVTTSVENVLLGSRFTDLHSGMRAYTRACLMSLPFLGYSDDFVFDSQLLIDAITSGKRVVEIPIPTRYSSESSSIAVGPSLRYVGSTVLACAKRSLERGRRGRRNPVVRTPPERALGTPHGSLSDPCPLCGEQAQGVVYPATAASGSIPSEAFACTTDEVGRHDDIVQCAACGFVRAIPTVGGDEILAGYEGVEDVRYLDEESGRIELFDWTLQAMSGFVVPGRRLLEVGSHVGLFLSRAEKAGWDARGVEPSQWAVETGRARFGVELEQGSLESMLVDDRSADAVVMLDVLEHLNDPVAGLKTVRRAIEEDGILVLSTVNLDGLHARVRGGAWPWFIQSHLSYYSRGSLKRSLEAAGFSMVSWQLVPRWFKLSYVAHRMGTRTPIGRMAERLASAVDPRLPFGWLGDLALVVARPIH